MNISKTDSPDLLADLDAIVKLALEEDIGSGDLTAKLVAPRQQAEASILAREACVVCGRPWFERVFECIEPAIRFTWKVDEGEAVEADTVICELAGPARGLLSGERTALNFLQTLSATATATRRYVRALDGTITQLLDTRKTLPGLRRAQKYAVHIGGGQNHRIGLYDAILIKENHIAAAGGITAAVAICRKNNPGITIEVEVENLTDAEVAVATHADMLLLDNFSLDDMRIARQVAPPSIRLEASGGIEADTLQAVAATGVDYISVGALTKNIKAVDLSMRIALEPK